ncbi:MAG: hypothetical protein ACP5RR_06410 [Candidatus Kapaibacteriota bacterium]
MIDSSQTQINEILRTFVYGEERKVDEKRDKRKPIRGVLFE